MIVSFKEKIEQKYIEDTSKNIKCLTDSIAAIDALTLTDEQKTIMKDNEFKRYQLQEEMIKAAIESDKAIIDSSVQLINWIKTLEKTHADNIFYSNAVGLFSLVKKIMRVYDCNIKLVKKACPSFDGYRNRIYKKLDGCYENLHSVNGNKSIYYSDIFLLSDAIETLVGIHHAILKDPEVRSLIYFSAIGDFNSNDKEDEQESEQEDSSVVPLKIQTK